MIIFPLWPKLENLSNKTILSNFFCSNYKLFGSFPVSAPPFKFNFEKYIQRCHNAMKFGVVDKSTILNRFVRHTLQRNITRLAVITRKTNINFGILKGGNWKRANYFLSDASKVGKQVSSKFKKKWSEVNKITKISNMCRVKLRMLEKKLVKNGNMSVKQIKESADVCQAKLLFYHYKKIVLKHFCIKIF